MSILKEYLKKCLTLESEPLRLIYFNVLKLNLFFIFKYFKFLVTAVIKLKYIFDFKFGISNPKSHAKSTKKSLTPKTEHFFSRPM